MKAETGISLEDTLQVVEIFSSIEGEGLMLGLPTIFVRLFGCPVKCSTCDTPESWKPEFFDKTRKMKMVDIVNSVLELANVGAKKLSALNQLSITRVSITGGEPLLFPEEIILLSSTLQKIGFKTNLETSGTIFNRDAFLAFDTVSMDIKTPSSKYALTAEMVVAIRKGYFVADNLYLKAVIEDLNDLNWLLDNFSSILNLQSSKKLPLVLTPCVAPQGNCEISAYRASYECASVQAMILAWNEGYNIAIIAQMHKLLSLKEGNNA